MDKCVYHYTSIQTLYHLLDAQRLDIHNNETKGTDVEDNNATFISLPCETLPFLATDIEALNDRTEYREVTKLISDICKSKEVKFADECIYGLPFVISFSFQSDSLPMWQQYADSGRGVCLRFDSQLLKSSLVRGNKHTPNEWIRTGKCNYSMSEEFKEMLKQIKDNNKEGLNDKNIIDNLNEFRDFSLQSAFLKDEAFLGECEWRIVIYSNHYLFYPYSNGRVARTKVEIPICALKEIIIGPCATDVDKLYVKRLAGLIKYGHNIGIDVSVSQLPYRTL